MLTLTERNITIKTVRYMFDGIPVITDRKAERLMTDRITSIRYGKERQDALDQQRKAHRNTEASMNAVIDKYLRDRGLKKD